MPGLSRATTLLRPHAAARQGAVLAAADGAAAELQAVLARLARDLGRLLRKGPTPHAGYHEAHRLAAEAWERLRERLRERLTRLATRGHTEATAELADHLPRPYLQALVTLHEGPLAVGELFAPLSLDQLTAILYRPTNGLSWWQRLNALSRLASPEAIAGVVSAGLAAGQTPQEIAGTLAPLVNHVGVSARRIARTESLRVAHEVQFDAWQGLGDMVEGYQVWATIDERTRPWHRARSGAIYKKSPGPGEKGLAQMPRPPIEPEDPAERPPGTPQIAYNCLLPGNHVQGRFLSGFKAHYAGQAVELRTAFGSAVRVTPNHPVLTPQGFVAAKDVKKGDQLACYVGRIERSAESEDDAPVLIQKVFRALKQMPLLGVLRRPTLEEDFHGDAVSFKGDVEVVGAARKLMAGQHSACDQGADQCLLIGCGTRLLLEECKGAEFLAPFRIGSATTCLVRRSDLPAPSLRVSHPTPAGLFGFGLVAEFNPDFFQTAAECAAAHAALLRKLQERFPGVVPGSDAGKVRDGQGHCQCLGDMAGADGNTRFDKPLFERVTLDSDFLGESQDRLPGKVAFGEVVDVKVFHYDGPVYDLETDLGYYLSNLDADGNGIILSNCRCHLSPVLKGLDQLKRVA